MQTVRSYHQQKKQKKINQQLSEENQELQKYIFANPNPFMKINKKGECLFVNQACEHLLTAWKTGLNKRIPKPWREVVQQVLLAKQIQTIEIPCGHITYWASVVPTRDHSVHIFAMDVTELKALESELEEQTIRDVETNLPNRVVFRKCLESSTAQAGEHIQNLALLIVRFDDYSQVVYAYGQKLTNEILVELTHRLQSIVKDKATVARLGENEFGIINPGVETNQAVEELIQPIISAATGLYHVGAQEIYISVSVGITFCPFDAKSPDDLARNAQLALNRATKSNQNYAFFQRGMEEQLYQQRQMVVDLHKAIELKQFTLAFQPQIDIKSQTLCGCEALVRWHHPQKGMISPFHFIPLAEETSQIIQIGAIVLEKACQQISNWKRKKYGPIKVAVNLSAQQILKTDIVAYIQQLTTQYKISPDWLSFELTETALVEDKQKAIDVMKQIKSMGFELALDDFGTGYSSLSYLSQFPIDKIKIDRSFVLGIKNEHEGGAILKGIVQLGQDMHLQLVAEGVELREQLNYLFLAGCDIIQGYLFGKPEPAETFVDFFHTHWKTEINKIQNNPPILIGLLHSWRGNMAVSEVPMAEAALMAIDEINQTGGLLGRPIKAVKIDGASAVEQFSKALQAAVKEHELAAIFGLYNSHIRKAMLPILEEHHQLLFYPVPYEGLEQSKNVIYTGGTVNQVIIPAIKWALDHLGKKFFMVGGDYIGPHVYNEVMKEQIHAIGGEVQDEIYIHFVTSDFDEIIQKIKKHKPDVIINTTHGQTSITFIQALRNHGVFSSDIPILSFNMSEVEYKQLKPEDVAGDYCAFNYFQSISSELNQQFIRKIQARQGPDVVTNDPIEAAYCSIYLWAQAVSEAGAVDVDLVKTALKGQTFQAPGGRVKVDEHNQHTWKVARVGKVNLEGGVDVVWSSVDPIAPNPYPRYRTDLEWQAYLDKLYKKWGNQWENPAAK